MWKAAAGTQINLKGQEDDDDWETDPDFVNDVNEQEQRWGSTTIEGSGRTAGAINMEQLRRETEESDALKKKQQLIDGPNPSFGYGGKFGVQKDRMDQSAVGHDYVAKLEKHVSQKDYSTGFGGKYGVQTDRVDKSAVSWDHKEKIEKHASQKDYTSGFGGKFGVQTDRQDKSAVGWDHVETVVKHESQKDYSVGFGGKFGVQTDRQDKSAVGWDHHEAPQKHESQTDHKKGFGGKFGVQTDRMDKSAVTFNEEPASVGTVYTKVKPDIGNAKPSDLRAKFEHMTSQESTPVHSPAPRKNIHAKAAIFSNKENQDVLDNQQVFKQSEVSSRKQLDKSRIAQFTNENTKQVQEMQQVQLQNLPNKEEMLHQEVEENTQVYEEYNEVKEQYSEVKEAIVEQEIFKEVEQLNQEEEIVDTGFTAVALYDYQAAADDEISFDPDDLITHVEMIDEGWWRGLCKGKHGLFPANYVQLQQ